MATVSWHVTPGSLVDGNVMLQIAIYFTYNSVNTRIKDYRFCL